MEQFNISFTRERGLSIFVLGAQGLTLVLGAFVFFLAPGARWLSLVFALFAILILAVWVGYLHYQYIRKPQTREKRKIEQLYQAELKETARYEHAISAASEIRQQILQDRERKVSQRQVEYAAEKEKLAQQITQAKIAETAELTQALNKLREAYFNRGMQSARLIDGQIPGVGQKMKERLALVGILNAADVSPTRLSGISGFGEAKVASVINWRNEVVNQLKYTAPRSLPKEVDQRIRAKYKTQVIEIERQALLADQQLPKDLADIDRKAKHADEENSDRENEVQNLLSLSQEQSARLVERLAAYQQITFRNYLISSMPALGSMKNLARLAGVALIAGAGLNSAVALGSTASIIAASIPTATSTPTITLTPTYTTTPSFTPTFTFTLTPSLTLTPTYTLTPTITETFTPTPTRPTATQTIRPTQTKRPADTRQPTATNAPTIIGGGISRGGGGGGSGCDPSYPTVCIPPPPPDLNCPDIPYNDFQVIGSDPHNFDRDNDGIGCET